MDVDKPRTQQTTSLPGKLLATLKETLWSSPCRDSPEQTNDAKSKTQDDSLDEVVCALESFLHEKIACSHLQDVDQFSMTPIQHCQQIESWDCGIACLVMISRWLSPHNIDYSSEMLPEEERLRKTLIGNIDAKSIWTADLVLELHNLLLGQEESADYVFCSKTMGVDESYRNFGYYRDNFARDQGRVKDAFVKLQEECSSSCFSTTKLPLTLLMNAVARSNCIAIALVDNTKMHASTTADKNDDGTGYVGHYVIVCGTSSDPSHIALAQQQARGGERATDDHKEDRCLVLMNPSQNSSPTMYVSQSRFERSWRATGTDDDIIFVIRQ